MEVVMVEEEVVCEGAVVVVEATASPSEEKRENFMVGVQVSSWVK